MALHVWLAISWCSTPYFIWPASAPRIGGRLSSPAARPRGVPCLLSPPPPPARSLCGGRKRRNRRTGWRPCSELGGRDIKRVKERELPCVGGWWGGGLFPFSLLCTQSSPPSMLPAPALPPRKAPLTDLPPSKQIFTHKAFQRRSIPMGRRAERNAAARDKTILGGPH